MLQMVTPRVGLPINKGEPKRWRRRETHLSTTANRLYSCEVAISGQLFEEKVCGGEHVPNKVTIEGIIKKSKLVNR